MAGKIYFLKLHQGTETVNFSGDWMISYPKHLFLYYTQIYDKYMIWFISRYARLALIKMWWQIFQKHQIYWLHDSLLFLVVFL